MAPYGVSITKQVTWRGQAEKFSNVYHYDTSSPINTDSGWDSLIDQIVALEKPAFHSSITWVQGRVWGPTNTGQANSVTQRVKDLSGAGTLSAAAQLPYEMTLVGQFYMGRSSTTQRKTFLRKYYHVGALAVSTSGGHPALGNQALAAGDKTPITTLMNGLKTITVGGSSNDLCKPNGAHLPVGSSPQVLDYLHVRQFKQ